MAYCPLAQGGTLQRMRQDFLRDPTLLAVAARYKISVMQLLLAFVLKQDNLIAIPKAGSPAHVRENAGVLGLSVAQEDWDQIDKTFWPPTEKMHLDIE